MNDNLKSDNTTEIDTDKLADILARIENVERTPIAQPAPEPIPMLKGNRTKLSNLVLAAIPLLIIFGINIDEAKALELIEKFEEFIAGGSVFLVYLVNIYYDRKGTKK